jgi:hypothetical protein
MDNVNAFWFCSRRSRDLKFGARSSFVYFSVLSRRKSRQVETCFFPFLSRLHVLGGAFLAPSTGPFSIVFMSPYPNSRPKEFRLVFASLAAAALSYGKSRRS